MDDHAVVRRGLAALLATATDLELVGMAADGAEAVRLAVESGADVVVMDLSMPGADGVTAIRRLATRHPAAGVVLTSFSDQARVSDALRAGADGYLLKHAEPEDISTASERWFAAEHRSTPPPPESCSTPAAAAVPGPPTNSPAASVKSSLWSPPGSTTARSVAGSISPSAP